MTGLTTDQHPIVLYKYKDVSGDGMAHFEDTLRNNRVWFSSPLEFNDPFDCRCLWDTQVTREEVVLRRATSLAKNGVSCPDAFAQAESEVPRERPEFENWLKRKITDDCRRLANTGIFCLTSSCDNPLMWTHYANKHNGICMAFGVRSPHETSHSEFIGEAMRVEYADRCPLINPVRDCALDIDRKTFLTKGTQYWYEAEWRIVRYNDAPGLKPIPKGVIGAVILGVQIDSPTRDRVIRACAEYEGEVDVVRAILDPHTYGLRLELDRTV
jgi:hypothetical protein